MKKSNMRNESNGNIVELSNVVQRFGEKEVLKGISLAVKPGEIVGLLGPSGAGKTTMIKIVTGQLEATSGTVKVDSTSKEMGMMMDSLGLYERLSCYSTKVRYGFRRGNGRCIEVLES